MSKTIDDQLERIATAAEHQSHALERIADVLEKLLDARTVVISGSSSEGVTLQETVLHAETADPEPEPVDQTTEDAPAEERSGEGEASEDAEVAEAQGEGTEGDAGGGGGEDDGDPLGGAPVGGEDEIEVPAKLNADVIRDKVARPLMEAHGKAAVFEALAEVGDGYKAVGEVPEKYLRDLYINMARRLKA